MTGTKVVIFHTNYQEYLKNNCEITSKNNEIVMSMYIFNNNVILYYFTLLV